MFLLSLHKRLRKCFCSFYHEGTEVEITSYNYQIPVWVFIMPMKYLKLGIIIKQSFIWFNVSGVQEHVPEVDQHRFRLFCYSNPRGWRQLVIVTLPYLAKSDVTSILHSKRWPHLWNATICKLHCPIWEKDFLLQHGAAASASMPFPACLRCEAWTGLQRGGQGG